MAGLNGHSPTILLADDDRTLLHTLESLLKAQGYKVLFAFDGKEAIEKIHDAMPDLCILDLDMPRLSGVDVCRMVKADADTRLLPVIMLTAMAQETEKVRALEAGCDDFLTKPVQASDLMTRIKSLLRMKSLTDALEDAEVVLFTLARTIEAKDPFTLGHADRVGRYAVTLGRAMGFDADKVEILRKGGILHDIGKLGIPDAVLQKEGPLDVAEWELMRRHPAIGCEICQRLKGVRDILPIIRHHHERLDGTGYPEGLRAPQIPDVIRIVNIVDIYDALTTRRSYKEAYTVPHAFEIMWDEVRRGWWDGDILKIWEDVVNRGLAF